MKKGGVSLKIKRVILASLILIMMISLFLSGCSIFSKKSVPAEEQAADKGEAEEKINEDEIFKQNCKYKPVNENSNIDVWRVLNYLGSLTEREDKRVVSGQFCGHGNEIITNKEWDKFFESVYLKTGKYPGMISIDYEYSKIFTLEELLEGNKKLIEHWENGGLVSINYTARNPFTGGSTRDMSLRGSTLKDLVNPESEHYNKWHERLDVIAKALKDLQDKGVVVLWRPMQEMNGTWFWYSKDEYADVWIDMFNYFKKLEINNLIWVWSVADGRKVIWERYPGDEYVDIVGTNPYSDGIFMDNYNQLLKKNKIIAATELGFSHDNARGNKDLMKIINSIRNRYPLCVWHMNWHTWSPDNRHALIDNDNLESFMNDPWIITREEINWRGESKKETT